MTETEGAINPTELPTAVIAYLEARQHKDVDAAVATFAPDGRVTDEGRTHVGRDAIRAWVSHSSSEYTYTVELTGATRIDEERYDVRHHLEGNFPGGVVDLYYRFELQDGQIIQLVIEP